MVEMCAILSASQPTERNLRPRLASPARTAHAFDLSARQQSSARSTPLVTALIAIIIVGARFPELDATPLC